MKQGSIGLFLLGFGGLVLAWLTPPRLFIGLVARVGWLAGWIVPSREVVSRNLAAIQQSGPAEKDLRSGRAQAAAVFSSYGRYWGEFLALAAHPSLYRSLRIRVEGEEHLRQAAASGAVCILTGHFGNWDLGARWAARRLPGMAVVAEPLRPKSLFNLFSRLREAGGSPVLSSEGAGVRIFRHLRRGGHVAMVADRSVGAGFTVATVLGGPRRLPARGIELARRAGATLIPAFLLREQGGYAITVYPPIGNEVDPVEGFARVLGDVLQRRPDQWCVLYPLHDGQG